MFSLMGNCMSWMKKRREPGRKITLAILGLDNAGKTVTAKSLSGEKPEDVAPTIGFQDVDFKVGKTQVTMFDLGGGKNIRDIWYNYLAEVHGVVYVVDSSEPHRLSECRHVLNNLVEDPRVGGKPLLLLANKQDVKGALDEIDVCEKLRIEDMVNMYKIPCKVETCSAVLGYGKKIDPAIKNGLQWLVDNINKDWDTLSVRVEKDSEEQKEKDRKDRERKREKARKIREEREEREKEQRRRRGLPSESEDEDDMDMKNGDPFKRYSKSELDKKEAKEKERKRRLKQWDEDDKNRRNRRGASDSDDDDRPHLNRRKNRFSDDELTKNGSRSARNYRSDDETKKGGLTKLSFRRSLEDLTVKRSPMLNRRNNRSRSPSPDLISSKRNFSSLNNRKSRSRSPSPPSRFGGRDALYNNLRTAAPGKLAPLRNHRALQNDYDSDKEPWQKNKLRSSNRYDDSDEERTPRSRSKYSSRNNDSDDDFPSRRTTTGRSRLRSSRDSDDDDDDDDRFRSSYGRSDRYRSKGRKTGDDSDSEPSRVTFSSDPFAKKGRSPRPSSPTVPSSLSSPRKSRNPLSSNYELAPLPRRGLAPLAPIAPLEPIKAGKKKMKNRFTSRNKTAPSPYDDDTADSDHTSGSDRQTHGTPRGLSTPPQLRSSFRASRSPRLAPMEEQENELDSQSSFSRQWGLDLPEPAESGYGYRSSHRYRPNVDSEDDLIT